MKSIFKKIIIGLLTLEARLVLKKYRPRVIAVTGSVGKTSAKDAIYTALANTADSSGLVRKSEKSFNSEIGVPLTVLGLPNEWSSITGWLRNLFRGALLIFGVKSYPKILVLEVGADHPGDITRTASWLLPDVAVLTRFPDVPVHVEFFASPEQVISEKLELVKYLKEDGLLVLNADDEKMRQEISQKYGTLRRMTYGIASPADIRATHVEYACTAGGQLTGMSFKLDSRENGGGKSVPMKVEGALGIQHVYPLVAATVVALAEGRRLLAVTESLGAHVPPPGRMRIIEGKERTTIIDDTYNSSPAATSEALRVLREAPCAGRRIAVLGDMRELGSYADEAHREVGRDAVHTADLLLGIGEKSHIMISAAREAGLHPERALHFEDSRDAGEYLRTALTDGDLILVKGSQSIRMERAVEALMAQPEKKRDLLVRQEDEWQER